MSLNTYDDPSQIPGERKEDPMAQMMKNPSFMQFILQMLRQRTLQPDPPFPPGMAPQPPQGMPPPQQSAPPPPNAMPNGGGFNPNNRPGMQGL